MYGAEAVLPEEIKHQSLRTAIETPMCPNEVEEMAITNLQKYQEETRTWKDPEVKL
jgi:hypothetical protein